MQINSFPGFFLVLHPFLALVTLFFLPIPNFSNSTLAHQPSLGLILVLRPSSLSIIRDSSFSSHSHSHIPISRLFILNSKYPTHPLLNSHPPPRTGYPPSFQSLLTLPTFLRPPLPLPLRYSTVPDSKGSEWRGYDACSGFAFACCACFSLAPDSLFCCFPQMLIAC